MPDETMGARLLRARLEFGARQKPPRSVTQLKVAEELGVSGVAVGGWEADRNEPGIDYIKALARFYGVRVGWIIEGELPMWRDDEGGQGATPTNGQPTPAAPPERRYPPAKVMLPGEHWASTPPKKKADGKKRRPPREARAS